MQSYVENVQDKNEVHRRDNLGQGKSAGDYSEGNAMQLKARMDRDAEFSLADMRIHYSASQRENVRSNEVVNRQPVIQRYNLINSKLNEKDQSPSSSDLPTSSSSSSEAEQQNIVDLGFNQRVFWPLGRKHFNKGWSYFPKEFSPAFANALYKKTGKLPVFEEEKKEEGEEVYYASQIITASVDGVAYEQGYAQEYKLIFTFMLEAKDIDELNGLNRQIWVMLPNYATGDQFTLAALVHRDPAVNVLIMEYGDKGKDAEMWLLFKKALNDTSDNDSNNITDQDGKIRVAFQPTRTRQDGVVYSQVPSYATDRVGANYGEEWTSDLRQNWELPDTTAMWIESEEWKKTASKIQEWAVAVLNAAKITDMKPFLEIFSHPQTKNIVILWFRHSGVAGGAHLELDTGMSAMATLIDELLKKENTIIILAGDRRKADRNSSGTGQQERESRFTSFLQNRQDRVFDFREFWKTPAALESSGGEAATDPRIWGGTSRTRQIRFYDCLKAYAASLRHIGSRSGNLELLALIGHDVDYFEEVNSYGGERMEPFYNAGTMDRGLHYQRISVMRPLTFKGNLVRIANYLLKTGKIEPDITSILSKDQVPNIMAIGEIMWKSEPKEWSDQIYKFYLSLYKGIFDHLNGICAKIKSDPPEGSKDISEIDPAFAGSDLEIFGAELKYLNLINPMIARISAEYKTTKGWEILEAYYRNYARVGLDRIVEADYDSKKS